MSNQNFHMPCKLDREVTDPNFDAFGHIDFANALRDLIESKENIPPYSIGLLGTWGTGKSSIKSLYCHDLHQDITRDSNSNLRNEKIKDINFNAWRYGGNANIKRALFRHVYLELEGKEQAFLDHLVNTIIEKFPEEIDFEKLLKKWSGHLKNTLFFAFFSALIIIGLTYILNTWVFPSNVPANVWLTTIFFLFIFFTARYYLSKTTAFEKVVEKIRTRNPQTELEEWESLLIKQIKKFSYDHKKYEKIVIFIDDLDRLSATEMIEGLDGIRAFMEICLEKECPNLGIVFVISCDESRVAEAIRRRDNISDLPGAIKSEDDARRYLDRIFQFRLEIPPFPRYDLREFALKQIESIYPELIKELESNGISKKEFINQLIPFIVTNPRNAIQLINAYSQSWWIAKKREEIGQDIHNPAGLLKGKITKHPLTLAIFCVLKVNFPHFYNKLIRHPTLIEDYSRVVLNKDQNYYVNLDSYTKSLLIEYMNENFQYRSKLNFFGDYAEEGSKEVKLPTSEILLHQYIKSIQGHPWPKTSLQPFIELNQDAINRKYQQLTYDVLISLNLGLPEDTLKNLDVKSEEKIPSEKAEILVNLLEEIKLEGISQNIENTAYVISSIIEKIPESHRARTIDYIKQSLEDSSNLRERIGIYSIERLINIPPPEDQKQIIAGLISDAFREDKNGNYVFEYKLTSHQYPTIDEARVIAQKIIEISLEVWKKHGLAKETRDNLSAWLTTRKSILPTGELIFNITFLEKFMDKYEDLLLEALGLKYSNLIITEIENGNESKLDLDKCLERCNKNFKKYCGAGGQDQTTAWSQVTRFISAKNEKVVMLADEITDNYQINAESSQIVPLIEKLVWRLIQDYENPNHQDIVAWDHCATTLNNLLERFDIKNNQSIVDNLVRLCKYYVSDSDSTCEFGIKYLEKMLTISKEKADGVLIEMSAKVVDPTTPDDAIKWLSNNYTKLNQNEKNSIQQQLNSISNEIPTNKNRLIKYSVFIDNLSDEALVDPTIQSHLTTAFTQIQNQYINFDNYISNILPLLLPFVRRKIPDQINQNINQFFINLFSQPVNLGKAHEYFIGNWTQHLKVDSLKIFDTSLTTAINNQNIEKIGSILISCNELMNIYSISNEDNIKKLISAAAQLWRNCPTESSKILITFRQVPPPESVSFAIEPKDLENTTKITLLQNTWDHIIHNQNESDRLITSKEILKKSSVNSNSKGEDTPLKIWFSLLDRENKSNILQSFIHDKDLQDEHFTRLWKIAIEFKNDIRKEVISEFITSVLINGKMENTANSISAHISFIGNLFKKHDERTALSEKLVDLFIASKNHSRKLIIANIIKEIEGSSQLKKILEKSEKITSEDYKILQESFSKMQDFLEQLAEKIQNSEEPKNEKP